MHNLFAIINETDHIVRIELTNGKKYNPLSLDLIRALTKALKEVSSQVKVKVLIISSEGPGFSAGHDLDELRKNKNNKEFFSLLFYECSILMQTIMNLPQPVIAEVTGIAAAAGCQLVASCDLAVASEQSSFMTPGVNIGLFCSTPMVAVSRNISRKKIMEMLLTGEKLNSQDAVQFGLINHSVPQEQLRNKTMNLAKLIASKPSSTVKIGKEAFYRQVEMPINEAYNYTSEVMTANMMEIDAQEGINAFLDKRHPNWNE
jgi:enoyl-CoA hydratase/carnithine racemase